MQTNKLFCYQYFFLGMSFSMFVLLEVVLQGSLSLLIIVDSIPQHLILSLSPLSAGIYGIQLLKEIWLVKMSRNMVMVSDKPVEVYVSAHPNLCCWHCWSCCCCCHYFSIPERKTCWWGWRGCWWCWWFLMNWPLQQCDRIYRQRSIYKHSLDS